MTQIFKYAMNVQESQILTIPSKRILSVKEQDNQIVIYALVDEKVDPIKYHVLIYGTGHNIVYEIDKFEFLDTVKMFDGGLMFHVFYKEV